MTIHVSVFHFPNSFTAISLSICSSTSVHICLCFSPSVSHLEVCEGWRAHGGAGGLEGGQGLGAGLLGAGGDVCRERLVGQGVVHWGVRQLPRCEKNWLNVRRGLWQTTKIEKFKGPLDLTQNLFFFPSNK